MRAKAQGDAHQELETLVRELRETAADQVHDLIVERDGLGSEGEVARSVAQLVARRRAVQEAQGRQVQAREMGLPLAAAVEQEREAWDLLRSTVMSLGAACGLYGAALDFERRRPFLNGGGE